MKEITVDVLELDGKDFILIDKVDKYSFFAEENNPENICIFKDIVEEGEEYYAPLDSDEEVDKAFILYYDKLKKQADE